ncbi:hypothetical protein [Oceaniglobus indicus]|uniref:hypothetical protein n=1 Tax=Oceaniglobus indicus TaxID=2047749 RepID=UPI000C173D06|nr:hypothetical protein [Oceaniglobus indicus]
MIPRYIALGAFLALAACGSDANNPFDPTDGNDGSENGGAGDDGTPISREGLPPGTASPTPDNSIFRREALTEDGNGFARDISYDGTTDTFTVNNLAFDGDTEGRSDYIRASAVSSLGPFAVYENTDPAVDLINGRPVSQFAYRAIYGVSTSGNSEFAIVRTGSYIPYGFGGFIYQRDGGVTLPTTGQGSYEGSYAGLRDFNSRGGLEYTSADAAIEVDFEDFNSGQGVRAAFTNRRIFDILGQDVTQDVIAAYNADNPDGRIGALPMIQFRVGAGTTDPNGEILGDAYSILGNSEFESGNYYAVVSGQDAAEITGVVVITSTDPRPDFGTVRETGGFIVYRNP